MLTNHQSEKKDELLQKLKSNNLVFLIGSAGTGKTYLLKSIINSLPKKRYFRIAATAPTKEAAGVLESKINRPVKTIHSQLRYRRHINMDTGEKEFKYTGRDNPLLELSYLIVDEGSMISSQIWEDIKRFAGNRVKVIIVGDDKQLPPVKEDVSPCWEDSTEENTARLTEIIRQGENNPIIALSNAPYSIFNVSDPVYFEDEGELIGIFTEGNRDKILRTLATKDNYYAIAFSNREVNSINKAARILVYGNIEESLVEGEKIISQEKYKDTVHNNEEIIVTNLSKTVVTGDVKGFKYSVPCYEFTKDGQIIHIPIDRSDLDSVMKKMNKGLKSRRFNYRDLYEVSDRFLSYKYAYARTIHKSQGKSIENVFISLSSMKWILRDTDKKDFYQKLLYTGITRASKKLILF